MSSEAMLPMTAFPEPVDVPNNAHDNIYTNHNNNNATTTTISYNTYTTTAHNNDTSGARAHDEAEGLVEKGDDVAQEACINK